MISNVSLLLPCVLAFSMASGQPNETATPSSVAVVHQPEAKPAAPPAKAPAPEAKPTAPEIKMSESGDVKYVIESVVEGVEVPWSIVFLPDGGMMFTERKGHVRLYKDGKLQGQPLHVLENVWDKGGENGLMGLCIHPQFETNKWVYVSYGNMETKDIRVERFTFAEGGFTDKVDILTGLPIGGNHAGCRIAFGPDGKLYITSGERFRKELSQDLSSLGGKILRVNDDGTIPTDNPFVGREGARTEIWAYGARNPQGIDWHPETGVLFETEHGPSGERGIPQPNTNGDEFNIVAKGDNLGWPTIHHDMVAEGMVTPLIEWTSAIAPGSGTFYRGSLFPALKNNYLVGGLRGERLVRIVLDGNKVAKHETLVKGLGRIRAIANGPDGAIYFSTSNRDGRGRPRSGDDHIFRLTPAP